MLQQVQPEGKVYTTWLQQCMYNCRLFIVEMYIIICSLLQAAQARPPLAQTLLSSLAVSTLSETFYFYIVGIWDVLHCMMCVYSVMTFWYFDCPQTAYCSYRKHRGINPTFLLKIFISNWRLGLSARTSWCHTVNLHKTTLFR